ncbi:MAG: cyclic nucleotide-binding domain-containing protein [Candidatus Wallbacteria bacterium]|nr:cyclic nucleotide-binding domain-containing protein [Candidatus Wallbacteria bacterium]
MRYLERGREVRLAAGETLFEVGAEPTSDGVYMVLTGKMRLSHTFPDGYHMACEEEPGGIFGLVDAMIGQKRLFHAVALEETTLYAWNPEGFEHCISVYIELAEVAVQVLSRQMRFVNEGLKSLG